MRGLLLRAAMRCVPSTGTGGRSNAWRTSPMSRSSDVLRRLLAANQRHALRHRARLCRHSQRPRSFASGCPCRTTRCCAPTSTNSAAPARRRSRRKRRCSTRRRAAPPARPSYIPITPSHAGDPRAEQALFSYLQYRACPEAFAGKALGIMGAAVEGHLDSGHVGRLGVRAPLSGRCPASFSRASSSRRRCRASPITI